MLSAFSPIQRALAVVIAALILAQGNDELREIHLGLKPKRRTGSSIAERLQAAYEKVMAKKAKG